MAALGVRAVALPASLEARMWQSNAQPITIEGLRFLDFMALPEISMPRPKTDGLADHEESTARKYYARVRQVYREIDALVRAEKGLLPVGDAWETTPPDAEHVWLWRNHPEKGSPARLETHRKALVWKWSYHGVNDADLPPFMRQSWATRKLVSRAQKTGVSKKRVRFLTGPEDVSTMLASMPFTGALQHSKMWGDDGERAEKAYLDDLFHTLVGLWPAACRPQDLAILRLENYQPQKGGIIAWAQRKKEGADDELRDAIIPETWPWTSDGRWYPSLTWYITKVRPRAIAHGRALATKRGLEYVEPAEVFLQWDGTAYARKSLRNFLSDGMLRTLGPKSPGPHGILRRWPATWRRRHGWSVAQIAELLGDTEKVVEESYLDTAWLKRHRPKRERDMPEVPIIRSNGQPDLWLKKGSVWVNVGAKNPQGKEKSGLCTLPGRDEGVAPHGATPRSRRGNAHRRARNDPCGEGANGEGPAGEAGSTSSFDMAPQPGRRVKGCPGSRRRRAFPWLPTLRRARAGPSTCRLTSSSRTPTPSPGRSRTGARTSIV